MQWGEFPESEVSSGLGEQRWRVRKERQVGKLSQSRSNALWRVLKERGALLEEDVGYERAFSCQDGESCGAGGHGTPGHERAAGGPTCVRTAPATASGHGDPATPGTGLSPPATASFNSPVLRVTPAPQGRKLRLRELKQPAQSPTAREGRDETQGPGCSVGQGCTSALPATNKESGVSASETGVHGCVCVCVCVCETHTDQGAGVRTGQPPLFQALAFPPSLSPRHSFPSPTSRSSLIKKIYAREPKPLPLLLRPEDPSALLSLNHTPQWPHWTSTQLRHSHSCPSVHSPPTGTVPQATLLVFRISLGKGTSACPPRHKARLGTQTPGPLP
ncbi:uncharacterized protein LOC111730735 [Pteropus vampyrus]|uniref:Uncharacterized protein LOC111730735 n=1 Tax=Pteropus vampyrus TaxID=132908 RepID=A0A6P6BS36_PTEVA|nr:uncharacterized protein LOC111730735 [Pteropus vampyrus]